MNMRLIRAVCATHLILAATTPALATDPFPTRPVHIIVNAAPGGLLDVTTRIVAQKMGMSLGQPVVVENRAGGDGLLGIRVVKIARPDGYTLLATASTIAIQPVVKSDPGYDLAKDFTGIGPMNRSPFLMVTSSAEPDKTLSAFLARARSHPGTLTYASAGIGTSTHMAAAAFLQKSGLKMMHIPYKGNGSAMPDVMSGRVNMIFEAVGTGGPKVRDGQLRALGVSSAARLAAFPSIPTLAEQGFTNFSAYVYLGLIAPAGTPKEIVNRLSAALRAATSSPELRQRFSNEGTEAMTATPEEFNAMLKSDQVAIAKLASEIGLQKQ
ncbi:Tripartite tricarboxylate transporter family receptor [Paraburkholderia sabiae]|uniref:Bug family tripartite tricarboxylate transporter substrate binding protein n=1 Tax=Paraburkholderia sabiae TaxID=273251 RepID=UPI001CAADBD8|nr:tripartite tricarboxylate transporter substrate binding protein [Paraburkholderia sabiae]CAG9192046.1 Tripartite tricarboxylate transporter family receptor [Paraburkholderia sabiae]